MVHGTSASAVPLMTSLFPGRLVRCAPRLEGPRGPCSPWHRANRGFRVKGKGLFEPQPLRRACRLVWLMCIVSQSIKAVSLTSGLASPPQPPEGGFEGAGQRTGAVSRPHGKSRACPGGLRCEVSHQHLKVLMRGLVPDFPLWRLYWQSGWRPCGLP